MTPREIILILIDAYGGALRGRTLLQKVAYFAQLVAGLELGFRAHYYGPYSPTVEQAVGELKSLGFVSEQSIGFGIVQDSGFGEVRRFDYCLTSDGKAVVADLKSRLYDDCTRLEDVVRQIKDAGDPDYRELSLAAKTYFILKSHGKAATPTELQLEATKFDWQLPGDSVQKAIQFLRKLNLVQTKD